MEPLFIGPEELGIQNNLKPFMVPEKAFADLLNTLTFRGRVQRKNGYSLVGRLKLAARKAGFVAGTFTLSTTAIGGSYSNANILADSGVGIAAVLSGARLVPGTLTITVGAVTYTDPNSNGVLLGNPIANTGTINYATGKLDLTFSPALGIATNVVIAFSIYPALPVMNIEQHILKSANSQQSIFFDTVYAYQYNTGTFSELPSAMPTQWHGTDTNFFCTTNFQQDQPGNRYFWEVNNNPTFNVSAVTLFAAAAAGPPSTVQVTAAGNSFAVGDAVTFVGLVGAGLGNNGFTGIVTVAGNPFTVSNNAGSTFVNGAVTQGVALVGDSLRYYQTFPTLTWIYTYPLTNIPTAVIPPSIVINALLVIPYKDSLVLLNTWEVDDPVVNTTATNYAARARWSQTFNATDVINGWVTTERGRGGFADAPTSERIVDCGFVKDVLIVYFERSTWQLFYTGNKISPFEWQRINSELGSDSTVGSVVFDNGLMEIGSVGLHVCNGQTCQRIDLTIPDEVFQIHNNATGSQRTCGFRDYFMECVYFSYADSQPNTSDPANRFYPNKIMCYNYRNETFSFFDDHVTAWGEFNPTNNLAWQDLNIFPWQAWNVPWNAGNIQQGFPETVFGNQQGFIEILESEQSSNGQSLYVDAITADAIITNGALITSPNHNLSVGQYVRFSNILGTGTVVNLNNTSFEVLRVGSDLAQTNGANQFAISVDPATISGTYLGAGLITVLTNVSLTTKMFTPYWLHGKRFTLNYIDILFDRTSAGEMTVDIYNDFSNTNSMTTDVTTGSSLGTPQIATYAEGTNLPYYSFTTTGAQIWKRFYTDSMGSTFQIKLSMNDLEMRTPEINNSDFAMHAMVFFFDEAGEFF
jgi:hypothetical protein